MTRAVGVVVLGMGRSGTSAVTRMFASTGFFAGHRDELMSAAESNPAGHWEHLGIWRANERILEQLGGSWFDPPPVASQVAAREWAVPVLRAELLHIDRQADRAPIVVKDPRIGVMMPLWHAILAEHLHPVLVIRDPIEIAMSLNRRDRTPTAFGLAAWELHMTALLEQIDGQVVTVIPYAHILRDDRLATASVETALRHIDPNRAAQVKPCRAHEAFEPDLYHNHAASHEHSQYLTDHQLELWRWLSSLSSGDQSIQAPAALQIPSIFARGCVRSETERVAHEKERNQLAKDLMAERLRADRLAAALTVEQHAGTSVAIDRPNQST
jgi:hypothetical protein